MNQDGTEGKIARALAKELFCGGRSLKSLEKGIKKAKEAK
jgi:hypothetical protein